VTGTQTSQAGAQAGPTGPLIGAAAGPAFLISSFALSQYASVDSFEGDYYRKRCISGKRSGDVFNDFLDILDGV
jgi:hypothetical protein